MPSKPIGLLRQAARGSQLLLLLPRVCGHRVPGAKRSFLMISRRLKLVHRVIWFRALSITSPRCYSLGSSRLCRLCSMVDSFSDLKPPAPIHLITISMPWKDPFIKDHLSVQVRC